MTSHDPNAHWDLVQKSPLGPQHHTVRYIREQIRISWKPPAGWRRLDSKASSDLTPEQRKAYEEVTVVYRHIEEDEPNDSHLLFYKCYGEWWGMPGVYTKGITSLRLALRYEKENAEEKYKGSWELIYEMPYEMYELIILFLDEPSATVTLHRTRENEVITQREAEARFAKRRWRMWHTYRNYWEHSLGSKDREKKHKNHAIAQRKEDEEMERPEKFRKVET